MTEPLRPADQTTIEDIDPPRWDQAASVSEQPPLEPATGSSAAPAASGRRRLGARWIVALLGVMVVIAGSAVIVALAAGRPTPSIAMGYMPDSTLTYAEVRLDLPGDQRQKLGEFLKHAVPGFDDQSQLDVKLNDVLDRLTRSATDGKQTWTKDIAPWFGGQLAMGSGMPSAAGLEGVTSTTGLATGSGTTVFGTSPGMTAANNALLVATITDRAKAGAWIKSHGDAASINTSTYNGADLYVNADASGGFALAVTDKVMLAGTETSVKAAVDTNGNGSFAANEDVKAAIASIDRDNVGFSLVRTKAYLDQLVATMGKLASGSLDKTQVDETLLAMVPAWQTTVVRLESDALAFSTASPAWSIGFDTSNHASNLLGHVPPKTVAYGEIHDVGKTINALLAKFRALPETKAAFDSFDQALAVVGGSDALFGWWGDTGLAVTPLANGTIGAGVLIQPTDPAAAKRLFDVLTADLRIAGANAGIAIRTEDHNGTTITVADLSAVPGMGGDKLPAGYKAEIAWAVNNDIAVVGYGRDFVAAVLDAGPGSSLADDARFKGLLDRVGAQNISLGYVDISGIRALIEPLAQKETTAEKWAEYVKEYRPYLEHFDALIGAVRKDGSIDSGSGQLTVR